MAQETVTEFKTVEEQKTRTLCDNCGRREEEAQILTVAINPKERVKHSQELELIKTFDDQLEADRFIKERKSHGMNVHKTPLSSEEVKEAWGVGWNHNTRTVNMNASAEGDMCTSCIFKIFGIEIPEDEEVEEIRLGEGEMNIDTTKEVKSIWPQIDIPEWGDRYHSTELGWKGKILFWPVPLLISLIEMPQGAPTTGNRERQKGYIAGSIGALLWASFLFTIIILVLV